MGKRIKLAAGVGGVLAALLLLTWTGEAYKHDGPGHSALYAGVRHVWRIELQGNRDARRKFALVKGYCVREGKPPGVCSVRAIRAAFFPL